MNRTLGAAARWLLAGLLLGACSEGGEGPSLAPDGSGKHSSGLLGVDDLMRGGALPGEPVQVAGVVSSSSAEGEMFVLIDVRCYEECGVTTCAQLYLPVRWTGPMPDEEQTVHVQGRVDRMDGKLIFAAESVESAE